MDHKTNLKTLPATGPDTAKFRHPDVTADGQRRAAVDFRALETLWFNTGTLCNLACDHCYIESSPTNDRLAYLTAAEVATYLDEIRDLGWPTREIGFTGGEPFMNPAFLPMIGDALGRGYEVLILTNAMRPMQRHYGALLDLLDRYGERLSLRVSIDHYSRTLHEMERGPRTWAPMLEGLGWLSRHGFNLSVAGRTCWQESIPQLRDGFGRFFAANGISLDAADPAALVLFPEMDDDVDVPEITTACWSLLDVAPASIMCATSRMVIKRKGAGRPVVSPCTLLPYEEGFDMAETLAGSTGQIKLNHPHCARFCVLGGGSCSGPA